MNSEAKQLRSLVAAWEKKRRHAEKMVVRLRSALELLQSDTSPSAVRQPRRSIKKVPPPQPAAFFSKKYEKTAKDNILELLDRERSLSVPEMRRMLASQKLFYTEQALALSMKSLEKAGKVRRRKAPRGSSAQYVYERVRSEEERRVAP